MNHGLRPACRRGPSHAVLMLALLAAPAVSQAQAILDLEMLEPRTFGYVIGDTIRREVHLSVDAEHRLDRASLPEAGRLDRWLELGAPEVHVESISNGRRYRLILTYQIFNAPLALETITIPQQNLRVVGETHALTALIPALRLTVAPLAPAPGTAPWASSSLQPDRSPAPIPVEARQRRLAWIVAGMLALLLYAAGRRGLSRFMANRNLPFVRAARELKRSQPKKGAPAPYAAGLKIVHEAINRTAGRAVFAHNLDDFLAAQPLYAGLSAEFHQLFAASGRVFFADGAAAAPPENAWRALLGLCERCSRIERRARRLRS